MARIGFGIEAHELRNCRCYNHVMKSSYKAILTVTNIKIAVIFILQLLPLGYALMTSGLNSSLFAFSLLLIALLGVIGFVAKKSKISVKPSLVQKILLFVLAIYALLAIVAFLGMVISGALGMEAYKNNAYITAVLIGASLLSQFTLWILDTSIAVNVIIIVIATVMIWMTVAAMRKATLLK